MVARYVLLVLILSCIAVLYGLQVEPIEEVYTQRPAPPAPAQTWKTW